MTSYQKDEVGLLVLAPELDSILAQPTLQYCNITLLNLNIVMGMIGTDEIMKKILNVKSTVSFKIEIY